MGVEIHSIYTVVTDFPCHSSSMSTQAQIGIGLWLQPRIATSSHFSASIGMFAFAPIFWKSSKDLQFQRTQDPLNSLQIMSDHVSILCDQARLLQQLNSSQWHNPTLIIVAILYKLTSQIFHLIQTTLICYNSSHMLSQDVLCGRCDIHDDVLQA